MIQCHIATVKCYILTDQQNAVSFSPATRLEPFGPGQFGPEQHDLSHSASRLVGELKSCRSLPGGSPTGFTAEALTAEAIPRTILPSASIILMAVNNGSK